MGLRNHIINFETYNLFLDDIRDPRECLAYTNEPRYGTREWVVVRTHDEFVQTVVNKWANGEFPELVSFDHDLACFDVDGNEMTGKNAVDYVIGYCLDNDKPFPKSWYVHSDNTNGRQNIIGAITNYLDKVEGITYPDFRGYHKGVLDGKAV
jgi:hypothetical protein